jgi:transposase-like protein
MTTTYENLRTVGYGTAETLRSWILKSEIDQGIRPGISTDQAERLRSLEREIRELKRSNEILRKAAAFLPRRSSTAE